MQTESAGIILAGGRSRRMGVDKALLEIDGETLLERSVRFVSAVVPNVLIVGRTKVPSRIAGTPAIEDAYPDTGPLGGIATGLERLGVERVLVVACDLPFLQVDLLRLLLELAPGYDAVVPALRSRGSAGTQSKSPETPASGRAGTGARPYGEGIGAWSRQSGAGGTVLGRAQPTCAVYASSCIPVLRSRLANGRYRLRNVLGDLHIRWVEEDEIRRVDPEFRSFVNANTPNEWHQITH